MPASRPENRGPAAAQQNRAALLAAAMEVFAAGGIDAPLNAVAKRAGVGQGSLYRHFPDRVTLALAVFEQNVTELETAAVQHRAGYDDLVALLSRQVVDSVGFVDILTATSTDPRVVAFGARIRDALSGAVAAAQRAGRLRGDVGADDVLLALGMVAAVVARTPAERRGSTVQRAWTLIDRGLRPTPSAGRT